MRISGVSLYMVEFKSRKIGGHRLHGLISGCLERKEQIAGWQRGGFFEKRKTVGYHCGKEDRKDIGQDS